MFFSLFGLEISIFISLKNSIGISKQQERGDDENEDENKNKKE